MAQSGHGHDVRATLGALVAGGIGSVALSAVLAVQIFLYFMIWPQDNVRLKGLVSWIWACDAAHTITICVSVWDYGVLNFNRPEALLEIAPPLAITVAITAVSTLNANMFYGWRIHRMSKGNLFFTIPFVGDTMRNAIECVLLSVCARETVRWVFFDSPERENGDPRWHPTAPAPSSAARQIKPCSASPSRFDT
ncbi:hypothetical protein MKEN_00295300 [Mycena kentingensis (nom. inval.)]|nr:hypothetical protein MKEN_00295300 [Mycena kentingensis (nom. inval.)]